MLSTVYNTQMDDDMLDTAHLFQPRGPGTAYLFRMRTPDVLIGRTNPRTKKPYGPEIREGLGGVRTLPEARKVRDLRLGQLRLEEAKARGGADDMGDMERAVDIAAELRDADDDEREALEIALSVQAENAERRIGTKRAVRWFKAATGQRMPFKIAAERYKADKGRAHAKGTLNSLNTTIKEFMEFAGEGVCLEDVDRRMAGEFVATYLPNRKTPKAPNGQGPASIRKKVSQLTQVWRWAVQRGVLPFTRETPWDGQGPSAAEIKKATRHRRPFTPEEARKLLAAKPAGTDLGDVMRVAMLTGVRLEGNRRAGCSGR